MSLHLRDRRWLAIAGAPLLLTALLLGNAASFAAPPAAAAASGAAVAARTEGKVGLVREAFSAIYNHYFDPVGAADLLDAAWRGATNAAASAGNGAPPPGPDLSGAAVEAYTRFAAAYTELEAATPIDATELAYAAIRGMTEFIGNCHTYFLPPIQAAAQRAAETGDELIGMGFRRAYTPAPWTVTYIVPGGPAEAAGLRAGDTILAYDGDSSTNAPTARSARAEGESVMLTILRPGEDGPRVLPVVVGRYRFPRLESRVIDGSAGKIGYLRFFTWERGQAQAEAIRAAIAEFEAQGVVGWVIDVRANGGGYAGPIAELFAPSGVLFREVTRGGTSYALSAGGNALAPLRPIAFLIGPGSGSASEIVPEALREAGTAVLVGGHTQGCMAGTTETLLSDGSSIWVTAVHVLIGGGERDLEGVGVDPDIPAPRSADDLAAGRDPALDAAVAYLQRASAAGVPAPALVPALAGVR
ncbi:MAG TPA: S41 family peptidase [Dehalococcoidia bacterium]|nr:S41 family peptidase [Dehalococcoidia bacterium]